MVCSSQPSKLSPCHLWQQTWKYPAPRHSNVLLVHGAREVVSGSGSVSGLLVIVCLMNPIQCQGQRKPPLRAKARAKDKPLFHLISFLPPAPTLRVLSLYTVHTVHTILFVSHLSKLPSLLFRPRLPNPLCTVYAAVLVPRQSCPHGVILVLPAVYTVRPGRFSPKGSRFPQKSRLVGTLTHRHTISPSWKHKTLKISP